MPEDKKQLRERIRITRDHLYRANSEFELALNRMGGEMAAWWFPIEACECGITPTVGVIQTYEIINHLYRRLDHMLKDIDTIPEDEFIRIQKRGSRRGKNYMDTGGGHLTAVVNAEPEVEEELPQITSAPKDD